MINQSEMIVDQVNQPKSLEMLEYEHRDPE